MQITKAGNFKLGDYFLFEGAVYCINNFPSSEEVCAKNINHNSIQIKPKGIKIGIDEVKITFVNYKVATHYADYLLLKYQCEKDLMGREV